MMGVHVDPWPGDCTIDSQIYMLLPMADGAPLVAREVQTPETQVAGQWVRWENFTGGFGQTTQVDAEQSPGGYSHALGVDASIEGLVIQGPEVISVTPTTVDSDTGITAFQELGGVLYASNGRYFLQRSSDSAWIVGGTGKDFGAGNVATDSIVFYSNADTAASLLVALGDGSSDFIWRLRSGVWAQHASLQALAFGLTGRELYRAHTTNTMAKVDTDADPWTAANWGAANAFDIGDQTAAIVRMYPTVEGTLLIFKTNGIHSLTADGEDIELFPSLRFAPDANNGKAFAVWKNDIYVVYGRALYRITPDLTIEQVGPELLTLNSSDVRGYVTCLQGTDHALYAGLYSPDDDDSYLMKFEGNFFERAGVRYPIWHGSLTPAFEGVKMQAMSKTTIGAAASHFRLMMGFDSGQISYFPLACTPNPIACDQYRFNTASDGALHVPRWHGITFSDPKSLQEYSVAADVLSSTAYAQIAYDANLSGSFTTVGHNFQTDPSETTVLPNGTSATILDQKLVLKNLVNTATPQVRGFGLRHSVRPQVKRVYRFAVLAEDNLRARDGTLLDLDAATIRANLEALCEQPGSTECCFEDDPDNTVYLELRFESELTEWKDRRKRARQVIPVMGIEQARVATAGTYGSIQARAKTYGGMAAYTYGQLSRL